MTVAGDAPNLPQGIARAQLLPGALFIRDWKRGCLW